MTKPNIEITMIGGNCPVQAEGTIDDEPFYFRARGQGWSLSVGGDDVMMDPKWHHSEQYGDGPFDAGWMPEDEALAFIEQSATAFAAWAAEQQDRPAP